MNPHDIPERPPGGRFSVRQLKATSGRWMVLSPSGDDGVESYEFEYDARVAAAAFDRTRKAAWAECRAYAIGMATDPQPGPVVETT